jgi:hypothetical protein
VIASGAGIILICSFPGCSEQDLSVGEWNVKDEEQRQGKLHSCHF